MRSGTASLSPACSAKQCWITCTKTKLTGAAYGALTHLQIHKAAPKPRTRKEELGREQISLNQPPVSCGVSSSSINRGKEYFLLLVVSSSKFAPTAFCPQALEVGVRSESLAGMHEKWVPLLEHRSVALQEKQRHSGEIPS